MSIFLFRSKALAFRSLQSAAALQLLWTSWTSWTSAMAAVWTTGDDSSPGTGETLGSAPEEPLPMITMTTCPFRLNDEVLKHYQLTKD